MYLRRHSRYYEGALKVCPRASEKTFSDFVVARGHINTSPRPPLDADRAKIFFLLRHSAFGCSFILVPEILAA